MAKLVTIYGGSGFLGRYIAQRMAKAGWRVRVAVRRPNEAIFVKPYGVVGQVEPVLCNIRDDASVKLALLGADVVVNCVGILAENRKNTFDAVQSEGAERIARLAAENGVARMVHISAIGADLDAASAYAVSKARGEAAIREHMPNAVILRPSIMFGPEDGFFNRFASMTRMTPVLPIAGGNTNVQPVYVDDVAQAAALGVSGTANHGVYELGGPEVDSVNGLMHRMLNVVHRRRLVLNLPRWAARIIAWSFDMVQAVTFGLITNGILTRDQLKSLATDNVVSDGAKSFADLGIKPVSMASILPDYLWRFRPSGQYDAIKESAQNMRRS